MLALNLGDDVEHGLVVAARDGERLELSGLGCQLNRSTQHRR